MKTQFRVVQITKIGFQNPKKESVVYWEGDDVDKLNDEYHRSEIFGADPLGSHEIEDGLIRISYQFQKFVGDKWTEVEDPRPLSDEMTELECEIDAENRRRYPGDYHEESCCYCGHVHNGTCDEGMQFEKEEIKQMAEEDHLYEKQCEEEKKQQTEEEYHLFKAQREENERQWIEKKYSSSYYYGHLYSVCFMLRMESLCCELRDSISNMLSSPWTEWQ